MGARQATVELLWRLHRTAAEGLECTLSGSACLASDGLPKPGGGCERSADTALPQLATRRRQLPLDRHTSDNRRTQRRRLGVARTRSYQSDPSALQRGLAWSHVQHNIASSVKARQLSKDSLRSARSIALPDSALLLVSHLQRVISDVAARHLDWSARVLRVKGPVTDVQNKSWEQV